MRLTATAIMLICLAFAAVGRAEEPRVVTWKDVLDLQEVEFDGGTAMVSRSLRQNDALLTQALASFVKRRAAAREQSTKLAKAMESAIVRINWHTGVKPDEAWLARQREIGAMFDVRAADENEPVEATPIYVVDLRLVAMVISRGGTVPGFTFDTESGELRYVVTRTAAGGDGKPAPKEGEKPAEPAAIIVPVAEGKGSVERFYQMLGAHLPRPDLATAAWVIAEATVERAVGHEATGSRWVVSGLAANIAVQSLREAGQEEATAELGERLDAQARGAAGAGLNLRYWLGPPMGLPAVTDRDRELDGSREAAAFAVVRRLKLIEPAERAAKVIGRLHDMPDDPIGAIAGAVDGLSAKQIGQAMAEYGEFEDTDAAQKEHGKAFAAAWREKRYDAAWGELRTWVELRIGLGLYGADYYIAAAQVLSAMGRHGDAVELCRGQLPIVRERAADDYAKMLVYFVRAARDAGLGASVGDEARRLFETAPRYRWAGVMVVRQLLAANKLGEARSVAQRVLKTEGDELTEDERDIIRQAVRQ